ncbi:hypothetical protein V5O48_000883 [Marasmius crinis-equi]|uniref:TPR-like protein n=1 Tax=Marasmius crinis-equi TaxID=585013 RepID=A0ABR3G054_9AGAR
MSTSQALDSGNHSHAYDHELSMLQTDTLVSTAETEFNQLAKRRISETSFNVGLLRALEDETPETRVGFAKAFMDLFGSEGDTRFLECVVDLCQHGLDALPESIDHDAQKSQYLDIMLTSQDVLAAKLEEKEMRDDAIDIYERAVKAAPDPHPLTATLCIALASAVQRRFNQLSQEEDLDKAISTLERAVACTSADDSLRDEEEESLRLLSELLEARWTLTKDQGDLDLLVACATSASTLDPSDPRNHYCLGRALLKMADASTGQDTAYLSDLLQCSTIPLENLVKLERGLLLLFDSEHDMRSLDHVMATCEHAIERYPDHDPRKFDHFHHLGRAFDEKGLHDDAIHALESAVDVASDLSPSTVACFALLGLQLEHRFRQSRDVKDLDQSIWAFDMAIGCTLEDESSQGIYHWRLSQLLQERWKLFKDIDDLERMVACSETAVTLNPTNPEILVSHGAKVRLAFEHHRTLSLIDLSIRTIREALLHIPRTSVAHAQALCHLGYSYYLRHQYLNNDPSDGLSCVSCLDEAETMQKLDMQLLFVRAQALTHVGHYLSNVQYLTKATSIWETLLNQELVQGLERCEALLELATTKVSLYRQTKNGATLEQAIQAAKDAIDAAAPLGSSVQARAYSLLGNLLCIQLATKSPPSDSSLDCPEPLSEPVAAQVEYFLSITRKMVSLTPEGSEMSSVTLLQHAVSLSLRGLYSSSNEDRRESILMFRQLALEAGDKSPTVRTQALLQWAQIAYNLNDWESSTQAYHMLLGNFEDLVWLGFSTIQQMQLLLHDDGFWITHLGSRSARCCVQGFHCNGLGMVGSVSVHCMGPGRRY